MENKQISLFSGISNPIEACSQLGEAFASSGLFGCSKPQQGTVLAMQCLATGMSPFELTQTYHIIDGKLSMKSDAMLGRFLAAGGKVVWLHRTSEKVTASWAYRDNDLEMSITLQELIANGVALAKGDTLKDNYRKFPRQMLTARLISEAVRLLAPEIVSGVYTPEEISDFGAPGADLPEPKKPAPPAESDAPKKPRKSATIEVAADVVAAAPAAAEPPVSPDPDPESEWKELLGEHYGAALNFFHATSVITGAQTLQHLPDGIKNATRSRTADLINKLTRK